jgi:hypothetical protein
MNLLKKLWNFLFGKKEEPVVLEEYTAEEDVQKIIQSVNHCSTHLRFRKTCPDCLRAVAAI